MLIYSKNQLIRKRIEMLRGFKNELKKETDLKTRARNLDHFKRLCRERRHDALAGYMSTPLGIFYDPKDL